MLKLRKLWDFSELEQVLGEVRKEDIYSIFPWGGCIVLIQEIQTPPPVFIKTELPVPIPVKQESAPVVEEEKVAKPRLRLRVDARVEKKSS